MFWYANGAAYSSTYAHVQSSMNVNNYVGKPSTPMSRVLESCHVTMNTYIPPYAKHTVHTCTGI